VRHGLDRRRADERRKSDVGDAKLLTASFKIDAEAGVRLPIDRIDLVELPRPGPAR
jgi:hypothetical protein